MKKWLPFLLFVIVVLAAGVIFLAPKGKPAPDFRLQSLRQQTISQEALKGKVTLLNFWYPSCPGCVSEMPKLIQMAKDYQNKSQFQIIGISLSYEDPLEVVERYAQSRQIPFTVLYDTKREAEKAYQIKAAPTSYLIDQNGNIIKSYIGEPNFQEVYQQVNQMLDQ